MIEMSVIKGFLKTLALFATGKVLFIKKSVGREFVMEDGQKFKVFRHVRIKTKYSGQPGAVFKIRFKPKNMTVEQNIKFSRLPMMVFMGFTGFRSKYWMVDEKSGLCQGLYEWQTVRDAENYSKSIALRFMTNRSVPGSVSFEILPQAEEKYWPFK